MLILIDPPINKPKAWRKLLRAPKLSNNPSNLVKLKESPRKFTATTMLSTKPPIINLLVR
jgi:hypothetical protein